MDTSSDINKACRVADPVIGFDLWTLRAALRLVASWLLPIAMVGTLMMGGLHFLYLRNPDRTDTFRYLSIDFFIVLEQLHRAATLSAPKMLLLGDSSCLMGIDARELGRALSEQPSESLCALGYLGPAGDAEILNAMLRRGESPKQLIVVLNPVQFQRDPSWDAWVAFVRANGRLSLPRIPFPRSALDYVRFEWASRWLYSPLPGAYALFYGSETAFRAALAADSGSLIDPRAGLKFRSLEALKPTVVATQSLGKPKYRYAVNESFRSALGQFRDAIARLGNDEVFLVVTPVQDGYDVDMSSRADVIRIVAEQLGIRPSYVLNTPATMPQAYFSTAHHLNRWGRVVYTDVIARELQIARGRCRSTLDNGRPTGGDPVDGCPPSDR